jgi:hypothetical protein
LVRSGVAGPPPDVVQRSLRDNVLDESLVDVGAQRGKAAR